MPYPRLLLVVCLLLWSASLMAPAVQVTGGPSLRGIDLLQQGFSGWRHGVYAWYANPLLFIAVIFCWFRYDRWALAAGTLGMLLALTSFWAAETARLAGTTVPDFAYQWGFYLWIGAQVIVLFLAFQCLIVKWLGLDRK